jgi:glycosyltransferase involved in cell wall biosynthesis
MRIGIDLQTARWSPGGLYYYTWNLFEGLYRLGGSHRVLPFVYGHGGIDELERIRQFEVSFAKLQRYWDGPPLPLLSNFFRGGRAHAPRFAQAIDRRLLFRLWRKLVDAEGQSPTLNRLARWLQAGTSPLDKVDVFHHIGILLFPLHDRANVLTVPDLTVLRVPQYHQSDIVDYFGEAFQNLSQMDMLITYSEHTKQDIIELLGVEADKIRVAPLAAHPQYRRIEDPEVVRPVLAKYHLDAQPYVLSIGTIDKRKNLERLIEAFHRVKQAEPALPHQLILVGEPGWTSGPIFQFIRDLHLENQVRWLGYAPFGDLPILFNGADLFAYLSLYEGFGLPPLEAMSCGTPVVASSATSLPEVVGDAGLLVDPYRVEDIAAAIHRALTDRRLRADLSHKGRLRAARFSWERTALLTMAAYKEAFERSQGRRRFRSASAGTTKCRQAMRGWVISETVQAVTGPEVP